MKKIRIGQIGIGHNHGAAKMQDLRRLSDLYEIVGIGLYEGDESFAERQHLPQYEGLPFMSADELLALPELDAVLIETAVPFLVPAAMKAVKRGLHIHLDKPGCEKYSEFERLVHLAGQKSLALQMGYMYRYNPGIMYAVNAVKSGALGEIYHIDAQMSTGHNTDFRRWLSTFPGGTMYIFGCHLIDLIVLLQGEPKKLIPFTSNSGMDGIDFADNSCAALVYEKGTSFIRASSVEVNGFGRRQFTICGSRGSIEIQPIENPLHVYETLSDEAKPWNDCRREITPPPQTHRYNNMLTDFAALIRGEHENPYTYEHDLLVHRLTLEACGINIE